MPARLLIVDDDVALLASLSEGLSVRLPDLSTKVASSAEEAFALLGAEQFDVILCDIVMPGLSGLDLLRRVREQYPGTAVVLITGCQPELREQALKVGATEFLSKPFTMDAMVSVVCTALERARLVRRLHEANRRSELARKEHTP